MINSFLAIPLKIPYCYINQTKKIQILRICIGVDNWIERAVFPDKYFGFYAYPDARLEVYSYAVATAVLSDRIPCQQLNSISYI